MEWNKVMRKRGSNDGKISRFYGSHNFCILYFTLIQHNPRSTLTQPSRDTH